MFCPSDDELAAFADGLLPGRDAAQVAAHIDECGACRRVVAVVAGSRSSGALSGDGGSPLPDETSLPSGFGGGRYSPRRILGAGGMGVVYEAWDFRLERTVALKVVLVESEGAHARLQREAQASARLAHPNIVAVFDVGAHRGRTFVVFEPINGGTLKAWARYHSPTPRGLLALVLQAGRGLAAAHSRGVLHLDVTPNNILVDATGVAKVSDFGLAQHVRSDVQRTAGTPMYVAPEIVRGDVPGPASDQYGLCATARALLREHSQWSALPKRIRGVLSRGLLDEPRERYGSMNELCAALEGAMRRRALPLAATAIGTLLIAGGRIMTAPAVGCPEVEIAPSSTGVATFDAAHEQHVAAWQDAWQSTCFVDAPRGRACLRAQRRALEELAALDSDAVARRPKDMLVALETWPDPSDCLHDSDSTGSISPVAQELREELAVARVRGAVDHVPARLERLQSLLQRAQTAGEQGLVADVLHARGSAHLDGGELARAEEDFEQSALLAYRLGQDATAVRAWLGSMLARGVARADPVASVDTLAFVDAGLERLGRPPALQVERDRVLGTIYAYSGDVAQAGPLLSRAAEGLAELYGDRSIAYARAREMWGIQAAYARDFDGGRAALDEAREIYEEHFGPRAPVVARALANRGALETSAAHWQDAARFLALAVELTESEVDENDLGLATYRGALATALVSAGQIGEGLAHFERSLASFELGLQESEPRVLNARYQVAWASSIASLELDQDHPRRAVLLERAENELRACLPYVDTLPKELHGRIRLEIGELALLSGDFEEAKSQCQRSSEVWTKPSGRSAADCTEEAEAALISRKNDESM